MDSPRIHVELDAPTLELQHEDNHLLMDLFIDLLADQLSLKWLNWCRVYLHATTLSDIGTADGLSIELDDWNGAHSIDIIEQNGGMCGMSFCPKQSWGTRLAVGFDVLWALGSLRTANGAGNSLPLQESSSNDRGVVGSLFAPVPIFPEDKSFEPKHLLAVVMVLHHPQFVGCCGLERLLLVCHLGG